MAESTKELESTLNYFQRKLAAAVADRDANIQNLNAALDRAADLERQREGLSVNSDEYRALSYQLTVAQNSIAVARSNGTYLANQVTTYQRDVEKTTAVLNQARGGETTEFSSVAEPTPQVPESEPLTSESLAEVALPLPVPVLVDVERDTSTTVYGIPAPEPVPVNTVSQWDPETGSWGVYNLDTGMMITTGLTEQEAQLQAEDIATTGEIAQRPAPATYTPTPDTGEADTKKKLADAQDQATRAQRYNQTTKGDWRVRLRLAAESDYLYNDSTNSLLNPLKVSDGIVFPYTPVINSSYSARYDPYDLTHSNYRGYFYRGSSVSELNIQATFTAQDTAEANYVLAVIHFFRSATKMFYGKDAQRGTPPPLVYLSGYGEYQFNDHACVISNFQYNLPADVDYISVAPNNMGLNMSGAVGKVGSSPISTITSAINRLGNLFNAATGQAGVPKGATPSRGDLGLGGMARQTVNGTGQASYVPTKIDMTITLLPIQTRAEVSNRFSVKDFANGKLLKGGFW